MASPTAQLIERREYKYLVDEKTVDRIRYAVQPFCELDRFGAGQPKSRYTIDSYYLDTPNMGLYLANEHEVADRFKLRLRTYPSAQKAPVFFEVKRRCNDVVSKARGAVPRDIWARLLTSPGPELMGQVSPPNRRAVERFLALAHTYRARPVTMVRYDREAYVSRIDDYARVTFDFNVRCQSKEDLSFETNPRRWRYVDNAVMQKTAQRMVLVELKFTSAVPSWMVNIVRCLNLSRASFSKYGSSMRAWYSPVAQRTAALPSAPSRRPRILPRPAAEVFTQRVTADQVMAETGPLGRVATYPGA